MLDFALSSSPMPCARWICVVALLCVAGLPGAAAASDEHAELRHRAEALDDAGRHVEAAEAWEALVDAAEDPRERMHGYMHAAYAWTAAFEASGDAAHLEAAASVLRRATADGELDIQARDEFAAMLDDAERRRGERSRGERRVALLDPRGAPPSLPARLSMSEPALMSDRPRPSPLTIAGGLSFALAAPALGGLVYALVVDRQLVDELGALPEYDPARVAVLKEDAREVRAMAIGFGVTSAALVGAGVGLVIAGRRQRTSRRGASLTLLPQATRAQGGLTLLGRF